MKLLILTVLNCFEVKYQHRKPSSRFPATQLESAIHEELTKFLIGWSKPESAIESKELGLWDARARVISWAIFGAAVEWSQEPLKISMDQMSDAILCVIPDGG